MTTKIAILAMIPLLLVAASSDLWTRGEALFLGREPLLATISGHSTSLPPEAVICANCHSVESGPAVPRSRAPRLDSVFLLTAQSRRNAPPSRYDPASFCRVLRSGVDPVYVLTARAMPRYDLDEVQCLGLWRFLTETKDRNVSQ